MSFAARTCPGLCDSLRTLFVRLFCRKKDGPDETGPDEAGPDDGNAGRDSRRIGAEKDAGLTVETTPRHPAEGWRWQSPQPTSSAVIFTALWSFKAREEQELSFREGDLFRVVERSGDWLTAEKVDKGGNVLATGVVPHNYLARGETVEAQPWYFGKMNRFEAVNQLLAPCNRDGAFLVRVVEKNWFGCVLSVKVNQKVKHFRVHQTEEGHFYVHQSRSFSSLSELVNHYRSHPLTPNSRLREACCRMEPKPQDLSHTTVDEWELPKDQFSLEEHLGGGNFADVYRGKWKNQVNVAIKVLKNVGFSLNHREFQLETKMLKKLRHKHLITLMAVSSSSPPYYIITELMEKGDLLGFLRGPEGQSLDLTSLVSMATQVADGMTYLESNNSIHRDLAARNVLVGENNICKVADFGLARVIKEPFYISDNRKIPYKWTAPEAIGHGRFSTKSDVWSFGVLLYEVLSYGGHPYPAYSNSEVYRLITTGYRMPPPPKCPENIYDIMLSCWCKEPDDRPHFCTLRTNLEAVNVWEEE